MEAAVNVDTPRMPAASPIARTTAALCSPARSGATALRTPRSHALRHPIEHLAADRATYTQPRRRGAPTPPGPSSGQLQRQRPLKEHAARGQARERPGQSRPRHLHASQLDHVEAEVAVTGSG